jgi:hypothetical protein
VHGVSFVDGTQRLEVSRRCFRAYDRVCATCDLGAGGVGGLVGGALARSGRDVVLLLRVETLA